MFGTVWQFLSIWFASFLVVALWSHGAIRVLYILWGKREEEEVFSIKRSSNRMLLLALGGDFVHVCSRGQFDDWAEGSWQTKDPSLSPLGRVWRDRERGEREGERRRKRRKRRKRAGERGERRVRFTYVLMQLFVYSSCCMQLFYIRESALFSIHTSAPRKTCIHFSPTSQKQNIFLPESYFSIFSLLSLCTSFPPPFYLSLHLIILMPGCLSGKFPPSFLSLPPPTTTMAQQQQQMYTMYNNISSNS